MLDYGIRKCPRWHLNVSTVTNIHTHPRTINVVRLLISCSAPRIRKWLVQSIGLCYVSSDLLVYETDASSSHFECSKLATVHVTRNTEMSDDVRYSIGVSRFTLSGLTVDHLRDNVSQYFDNRQVGVCLKCHGEAASGSV